jgi:hypothetical protein
MSRFENITQRARRTQRILLDNQTLRDAKTFQIEILPVIQIIPGIAGFSILCIFKHSE